MQTSGGVCCQQHQDVTGQSDWLVLTDQRKLLEGDSVMAALKEALGIALAEDMEKRPGCHMKQNW